MSDQLKYVNKLKGTRVLIFGGSSGIGYGTAEGVIEYGAAQVIVSASRESRVQETIQRLRKAYPSTSAEITGFPCNLSDEASLESNIKELFTKVGTIDHIIFTAGDQLQLQPIREVSLSQIKAAGMVRFFSPLLVAKYGSKVLAPGPASSIILTTGSVSEHPIPGWSVIGSYASGLHGMTRGLALDLKPIRVNLISPGPVETEMWNGMSREAYASMKETSEKNAATGLMGQVSDVVEAYLYCMRDHNVTGAMISTSSGQLLT